VFEFRNNGARLARMQGPIGGQLKPARINFIKSRPHKSANTAITHTPYFSSRVAVGIVFLYNNCASSQIFILPKKQLLVWCAYWAVQS
jgi:hypothetical protein